MSDILTVKDETDAMKGSEAEFKDTDPVENLIKSGSQEQIQAEKDENCPDSKNNMPVRSFSLYFSLLYHVKSVSCSSPFLFIRVSLVQVRKTCLVLGKQVG